MSDKYTIDFNPQKVQIEQLKSWMIEENQQRTGLVHDLNIIARYANRNSLATIILEDYAIGFATWDIFKRTGHIEVAAVAPKHRRSGVGRYLMEAVFDHLLEKGVLALYLECAPAVSEKFWRKMGFNKMPRLAGYSNSDAPCLYKSLLSDQNQGISDVPFINVYEWGSTNKQRWPINYKPGTNQLLNPIIAPVSGDWCIESAKATTAEQPEIIKNFLGGKYFDAPFLIITVL